MNALADREAGPIGRALAAGALSALLAGAASCAAGAGAPPVRIVVDSTIRYQRILGWEAAAEAGQEVAPLPRYRDRLLALAVDSVGLNRLRLGLRSGQENSRDYWSDARAGRLKQSWRCVRYSTVNDNADPNVIAWSGFHFSDLDFVVETVVLPMKKRLEARGERLFVTLTYIVFLAGCPNERYIHTDPEEYAEFILAASLHLRSRYGLVPDAWELVNEPDNTAFWRGEQLGRALVATARRLRAAGFAPRFVAPSTANPARAVEYFDGLARVPGALEWMSELSYHRYAGAVSRATLRGIAERASQHHLATAMLEHMTSGYEDLHEDLRSANVSAWEQFALAYPGKKDGGGAYFLVQQRRRGPVVVTGERTRLLRQYFHYIRTGAVRVEAHSQDPSLDPLAFVQDGRVVVVVKAESGARVAVAGLPRGRYVVSYATEGESSPEIPLELAPGAPLLASIPDRGVLTIAAVAGVDAGRAGGAGPASARAAQGRSKR